MDRREEELFRYQEDATAPDEGSDSRSEEERELEERQREQVQEVLGMPGYSLLHKIMVEKIGEGQAMLGRLDTPAEHLRYWQGVVAGIAAVQNEFVGMGKTREERRMSYGR